MFRDKYTVGNVCLMVFLAFIFSVITAIVKVEPAIAAPAPLDGTTVTAQVSGSSVTVSVKFNPVTPVNYGSLRFYVTLLKEDGSTVNLSERQFQVSKTVYGSAYSAVMDLVYSGLPANFQLAQSLDVVYSSIVNDAVYNSVYLTLKDKPPVPTPGGGGGGGGGSTVVSNPLGDLEVSGSSATLVVDQGAILELINTLPADAVIELTITAPEIPGAIQYDLPVATIQNLAQASNPVQMTGPDNTKLRIPMDDLRASLPPGLGSDTGGRIQVRIIAKKRTTSARVLPRALAVKGASDAYSYLAVSASDFVTVSDTYEISVWWVPTQGDARKVDVSGFKNLMEFKVLYDPNKVVDVDRVAAIREEGSNIGFQPRVFVDAQNRAVTMFISESGEYTVVQSLRQFNDVASHWAKKEIITMASRDIARGFPGGKFDPEGYVTRAEYAALLVRTLGRAEVKPEKPTFADVPAWAWHFGPVETGSKLGLVKGYDDGTFFKPDGRINRQELAAMTVRAMDLFQKKPTVTSDEALNLLGKYVDAGDTAVWAKDSVARAMKAGIVQGRTETTIQSLSTATRAEAIVMLWRMLKYYGHIQ